MHTPLLSAPRRLFAHQLRGFSQKKAPRLSDSTLPIRLAAVDTPEVAKFGKPAQPFADEAKAYVSKRLLGKSIRVKLLSRDQYGRAVASIKYRQGLVPVRRDLGEDLLADGLAVVYRQRGAQYDSPQGVEKWNKLEAHAKSRGKGLWGGRSERMELPSEYKARMRTAARPVGGR
ncbi:hypothetical protein T492DRAFT_1024237 [Pavlovales sp. CCMP2436]|nr:hypothetical protein T492DRAFT_1024237 [Pavlovales sp. CCMP2436]